MALIPVSIPTNSSQVRHPPQFSQFLQNKPIDIIHCVLLLGNILSGNITYILTVSLPFGMRCFFWNKLRLRRKMGFRRKLRWLILVLMPLLLFTGCGDLEPDMQDTRTVILNMDFHKNSSSRTNSSVSAAELSNYKTHLFMVLTSGKNLSNSSYWNYNSNLGEYVLNYSDRKITLNVKLNTEK